MFNSILHYRDKLEDFDESIEAYQTNPSYLCAGCLADSDYYLKLMGNTPEAYRDRYEFREGAAAMFAAVFGYDLDMARAMMFTHQAWSDYEQAKE